MSVNRELEYLVIEKNQEIRFSLDFKQEVKVFVDSGSVLLFGCPLQVKHEYVMRNQSFALSTFDGCTIKVEGSFNSYYICNISIPEILTSSDYKPCTMIIGPPCSGKTTFAKWMMNYSCLRVSQTSKVPKQSSIYVNLDPQQSYFSPAGCIGALPISKHINHIGFPYVNPLVYFFGHLDIDESRASEYRGLIKELSIHVKQRQKNAGSQNSGIVIDFPFIKDQSLMQSLCFAIETFEVTHIVCLGDDKTARILAKKYNSVKVIELPTFPGAVIVDRAFKQSLRNQMSQRYFDGDPLLELNPVSRYHKLKDIKLFSVGGPQREAETTNFRTLVPVPYSLSLKGSIIAAVNKPNQMEETWKQNSLTFFYVLSIDEDNGRVELLMPNSNFMSDQVYLIGSIKYSIE